MDWLMKAWNTLSDSAQGLEETRVDVQGLSKKCKDRFNDWKKCKSVESSEICNGGALNNYYSCVKELNAVRIKLDNVDRKLQEVRN
jgi:hypothetical protein